MEIKILNYGSSDSMVIIGIGLKEVLGILNSIKITLTLYWNSLLNTTKKLTKLVFGRD